MRVFLSKSDKLFVLTAPPPPKKKQQKNPTK